MKNAEKKTYNKNSRTARALGMVNDADRKKE